MHRHYLKKKMSTQEGSDNERKMLAF